MNTPTAGIATCTRCDFLFCSHHSHDVAGIEPPIQGFFEAVCVSCLQRYVLPTQGSWGAAQAEILELHTLVHLFRTRADRRAGRRYRKRNATGALALFDRDWYVAGVVPDIDCPSCGAHESVAVAFMDRSMCPACKVGVLECQPAVI